ncbi:helix-turn-helix domain-containing protein [Pseudomonas sp. RL_5y_Pfl2_69]|jgi:transcriptional regulator with XRE-family HTH domain|uniref:helix-turn-helix domain-containing protein n=1 Tax=Pseudomonas sp. RL_5y_Pfl2_69 TaxID=3088711 RepID=UPI0030DBC038
MSTYGKRLREERLRLNLTQQQLALAGGIGRNTQSLYERDLSLPRADYLALITLLGIDVLYILNGRHTLYRPPSATVPAGNGQLTKN